MKKRNRKRGGNEFVAGGVDLSGYTQSDDLTIKFEVLSVGDGAGANATASVTINGVTRTVTGDDSVATPTFVLSQSDFGGIFESGQQIVITGANTPVAGDRVNISITGEKDGITGLSVISNAAAGAAVDAIDNAIELVSNQRSQLGAYQNRLEYTINNLGTAAENLSAAESRIRDVDMANEMVEFTKMNILSQAAQSMLAQANQRPRAYFAAAAIRSSTLHQCINMPLVSSIYTEKRRSNRQIRRGSCPEDSKKR